MALSNDSFVTGENIIHVFQWNGSASVKKGAICMAPFRLVRLGWFWRQFALGFWRWWWPFVVAVVMAGAEAVMFVVRWRRAIIVIGGGAGGKQACGCEGEEGFVHEMAFCSGFNQMRHAHAWAPSGNGMTTKGPLLCCACFPERKCCWCAQPLNIAGLPI